MEQSTVTTFVAVLVATFVTHVAVTAVWPDGGIDWATSAVVAVANAAVLTVVLGRRR